MAEVKKMSEGLVDGGAIRRRRGRRPGTRCKKGQWRGEVVDSPGGRGGGVCVGDQQLSVCASNRKLMSRAKDRATDLPDADLFGRVKEVTGVEQSASSSSRRTQSTRRRQTRRSGSGQTQRRRKTKSTA